MNGIYEKEPTRLGKASRQRFANLFATTGLILTLAVSFFVVSGLLRSYSINFCLKILKQEAQNVRDNINYQISLFQNDMDILAHIISQEEDLSSPRVQAVLQAYEDKDILSRTGILFPDDQVMLPDGTFTPSSGRMSFHQFPQDGPFFSNAEPHSQEPDHLILYYAIPIKGSQAIKGFLFGVMDVDNISRYFDIHMFDGKAHFYIMDPKNMNLVLDTLHGSPGNSDATEGHQIKKGYKEEQIISDFINGKGGLTAYLSTSLEEYLYTAYEPLAFNDWFIMLSVPESIVFNEAKYTKTILFCLGIFECLVLTLYFLWILLRTKKEIDFKEYQIRHIHYMYNVQHALFDAYRQPENITISLKLIAQETKAKGVLLAAIVDNRVCRTFSWRDGEADGSSKPKEKQIAQALVNDMLLRNSAYTASAKDRWAQMDENLKPVIQEFGILRWMAIPIEGRENRLIGVLAAINADPLWNDTSPLTSVALSFSMALYNIQAYQTIEKMGTTDALTGLLNRNAYEQKMKQYEAQRPQRLTCIYADANGLHELNNSQGHAAGDRMLQCVAHALADAFEDECVYRIGGDEFLVLTDMEETEAAKQAAAAKQKVADKGYHVSVGTASGSSDATASSIVKTAEMRMYEDKRQYYIGSHDRRQMR